MFKPKKQFDISVCQSLGKAKKIWKNICLILCYLWKNAKIIGILERVWWMFLTKLRASNDKNLIIYILIHPNLPASEHFIKKD